MTDQVSDWVKWVTGQMTNWANDWSSEWTSECKREWVKVKIWKIYLCHVTMECLALNHHRHHLCSLHLLKYTMRYYNCSLQFPMITNVLATVYFSLSSTNKYILQWEIPSEIYVAICLLTVTKCTFTKRSSFNYNDSIYFIKARKKKKRMGKNNILSM